MALSATVMAASALAVWRVTHALHAEDGPAAVFERLRRAAGAGFWGAALGCFYCLSLWVAMPCAALGTGVAEGVLLWLAASGAACLLERWTGNTPPGLPSVIHLPPEQENRDVLLPRPTPGPGGPGAA